MCCYSNIVGSEYGRRTNYSIACVSCVESEWPTNPVWGGSLALLLEPRYLKLEGEIRPSPVMGAVRGKKDSQVATDQADACSFSRTGSMSN